MASENIQLNRTGFISPALGEVRRDRNRPINVNNYASKKSAAQSMLDVALLMANASQLNAVIGQGPDFKYYILLIILITISILLQTIVGILLIFSVKTDLNKVHQQAKLEMINNITTGLIFIIVIMNILITAFGVQQPPLPTTVSQQH